MKNPFVYGEIVPLEAFADRVIELDRLVTDLAEGQKVFLISPRRYGKSSLVRQALAQLARKRILTLEVTVSSFSSYVAFLEGYARALLALETKAEKARGWLRELFPGITARRASRGRPGRRRPRRLLPGRPHAPRRQPARRRGVRAARAARRAAPPPDRRSPSTSSRR